MSSNRSRWVFILLALILGAGLGLAYGWYVDPVDFFDLTPDTLRADYKADYVLMTAEAYSVEQDPGLAARRLAIHTDQPGAPGTATRFKDATGINVTSAASAGVLHSSRKPCRARSAP